MQTGARGGEPVSRRPRFDPKAIGQAEAVSRHEAQTRAPGRAHPQGIYVLIDGAFDPFK